MHSRRGLECLAVSDPRPGLWPLVLEGAQRLGSREEEMLLFTREGEGWETHKLTEEGAGKGHCLTWVEKAKEGCHLPGIWAPHPGSRLPGWGLSPPTSKKEEGVCNTQRKAENLLYLSQGSDPKSPCSPFRESVCPAPCYRHTEKDKGFTTTSLQDP